MAKTKGIVGKIIAAVLVFCLIAAIIGGTAWLTNGFKDEIKTFAVKIDDMLIVNNTENFEIKSGTVFNIVSPFSEDYSVDIYSRSITEDFDIIIGAETYTWESDCVGRDYLRGFSVVKEAMSFTLEYDSLRAVIAKVIGFDANMIAFNEDSPAYGYMFEMRIQSGMSLISITFALEGLSPAPISAVDIDSDGIIF